MHRVGDAPRPKEHAHREVPREPKEHVHQEVPREPKDCRSSLLRTGQNPKALNYAKGRSEVGFVGGYQGSVESVRALQTAQGSSDSLTWVATR